MVGAAAGTGICIMDQYISTGLAPCLPPNNWCLDQTDICVNHPLYNDFPVCMPKMLSDPRICPPIPSKRSTRDLGEHCTHVLSRKGFLEAPLVVKISIVIIIRFLYYGERGRRFAPRRSATGKFSKVFFD